jgi:hypothetical protein
MRNPRPILRAWQAWRASVALMVVCVGSTGCVGPEAVRATRLRYNEAIRSTNDEQLLINLVRLRYADSPVFIDLPSITSQFELAVGGSDPGAAGSQTNFGIVGLTGRDSPTLSYHPRQGREISKALLNPLSAEIYSVVTAGARIDQLLWLTLNDINDVQNAVRGTLLVPMVADDNSKFLRGVKLLAEIDDQGGAELGFSTIEETSDSSDPIDKIQIEGKDLLAAAKDGYVYRDKGQGQMTLNKRQRGLSLKIRSPFNRSPEMEEMASIFNLAPHRTHYKVESELEPDDEPNPGLAREGLSPLPKALADRDTIYLNLRSMLQVMTFMSKGVCVPEEHIRNHNVPVTIGPDGRPFDWTSVTRGYFRIASQKQKPRDAEVAVKYRGYWFWIPKDDVDSRAILAILEILFSLQDADDTNASPVLTLPAGR